MFSSEVQRTLVKSPPELWAELSDPDALARHLGELGEIRIVRTEPESTVEWTAENTTGTVSIKPSGWGTKVTLSVTREHEQPASVPQARAEAEAEQAPPPRATAEPTPEPVPQQREPAAEPIQPEPEPTPAPRRGFFARLFARRGKQRLEPGAPDAFAAVREVLAPATVAAAHAFAAPPEVAPVQADAIPAQDTERVPIADISAELMVAEEVAAEEVTALLTAVLDRLGAAHHRPFSRA